MYRLLVAICLTVFVVQSLAAPGERVRRFGYDVGHGGFGGGGGGGGGGYGGLGGAGYLGHGGQGGHGYGGLQFPTQSFSKSSASASSSGGALAG